MKYEFNNIYNEDSYKAIKEIPDKSIDLIIIDPPYVYDSSINKGWYENRNIGNELINLDICKGIESSIFNDLIRIMKKINIYIWCNKAQIIQYLDFFVKEQKCSFDIILWQKTNPAPLYSNTYLPDKEYCLYFRKNAHCKPNNYEDARTIITTSLNVEDKKHFIHPTIKPIEIIKKLIKNSSNEGDIIADFFLGSGTTAVAAKELNRKYLGFEIDKQFFKIAKDRLNGINANGQTSIFTDFENL